MRIAAIHAAVLARDAAGLPDDQKDNHRGYAVRSGHPLSQRNLGGYFLQIFP